MLSLKYCSHLYEETPSITLNSSNSIQIYLINNFTLVTKILILGHKHAVENLCFYYGWYHGLCLNALTAISPPLVPQRRLTVSTSTLILSLSILKCISLFTSFDSSNPELCDISDICSLELQSPHSILIPSIST